ncbi:MAG: RibD family protein, partial [Acidiferrobacterales bacterium]
GEDARRDVHRWRARSSAILTGVSTILMDDPSLNVRYNECERQPLRIVLDSNLRISPDARVIKIEGKTLIVTASHDHEAVTRLQDAGAEVLIVATNSNRIDLHALMLDLVAREINEIHIEAGATLCGALLYAGIVDELVLYLAPHLLGTDGRGMFKFPALEKMADRYTLKIRDVRAVGEDWRVIADVINLS